MSFTSVVVVLDLNRTRDVGPTTLSQVTDCRVVGPGLRVT